MQLHNKLFNCVPAVRYVAVADGDSLSLHERPGLEHASESESDKYEELLVNPTIISLAKRRGDIDCGGLDYVIIRYGNFYQLVVPTETGHVSTAIELEANLQQTVDQIHAILRPQPEVP